MTYEEFLRTWFDEKNDHSEYYDIYDEWSDTSAWKGGWEEHQSDYNDEGDLVDENGNRIDDSYYYLKRESSGVLVIVNFGGGEYGYIDTVRIEADGVDVASEEIGTIDAVDALLGTGLDAASKKAEELKKRKLVTVANLQKALEDYDERKGTAVEDGEPTAEKNKVFIDGSGRVYARRTELAQKLSLDVEKSERQSADNRLSDEIAKKADKEHTHKAADITDMPNYARSVNGEEPDADGNVEIDIDAVVEVAELPGETKKKVYLVPEKEEQSVSVDCSSVESMMAAVATWLTGETQSPTTVEQYMKCLKATTADKGSVIVNSAFIDNSVVTVNLSNPVFVNGKKANRIYVATTAYTNESVKTTSGDLVYKGDFTHSIISFYENNNEVWEAKRISSTDYDSGWTGGYATSSGFFIEPLEPLSNMTLGEDKRTPPAVYAKSVELATKEALSEATSGADEKAAALGERIGAVESSVTEAKSDITAMKSDITEAQADITTAQSDLAEAKEDIEAVTSEVETVKADVAALETKVVRSVNGTEPDENGNVEVASSSDSGEWTKFKRYYNENVFDYWNISGEELAFVFYQDDDPTYIGEIHKIDKSLIEKIFQDAPDNIVVGISSKIRFLTPDYPDDTTGRGFLIGDNYVDVYYR